MNRSNDDSDSQGLQQSTTTGSLELSTIDPYPLLGLGAALALYDREEDVANFVASAVTSALRFNFGAVALMTKGSNPLYVFGQLGGKPLRDSLAKEIGSFLSKSSKDSEAQTGDTIREIGVRQERLAKLLDQGLSRILLAPLRTLGNDFGVVLAGKSSDEPYLRDQTASLLTLAGQTSMALHRIQLKKEHAVQETALRESEERLSLILESAMDAIITIDAKRTIVLFNQAAEKVFGCTTTEAVGHPVNCYFSEGLSNLLTDILAEFRQGKKTQRYMWAPEGLIAFRAGGEEFPIEATIAQFKTAGHKFFTIILRDINERKMAEQKLHKLQMEKVYLQEEIKAEYNFEEIVGDSGSIKKVFQDIESVAKTNATVLITGETGTGKELIARAIHHLSLRNEKVMVKVNCSALPSGLIESELFGHEKGAFTGALSQKIGRFELANGGSIFLDEIGDLQLELQAKLLRVLQEGELERVGGSETIKVNVRIIAATNRHLGKAIEDGSFRPDLYYRLNVFPIHIPPLHERREDIPSLVRHFVMKHGVAMGKAFEMIPQKMMQALVSYSWPGNVRELANIIERAVIVSPENRLELGDWLPQNGVSSIPSSISTLEELEKGHIIEVLELTGWRVSGEKGAARILGMKPTTLESKMKKLGIERQT